YESEIIAGNTERMERLTKLVTPFMMRRLKSDVLKELPDKLEAITYAVMDPVQAKIYYAVEQNLRESLNRQRLELKQGTSFDLRRIEVLAEITKLRQVCCDPHIIYDNYTGGSGKLDTILELTQYAISSKEKVLIFSQFTTYLSIIANNLKDLGISFYTITGATPKQMRVNLVNAFNNDDTPVFLVSLKAGGTGLNLTGASVVIHADPWWNAAAQNQATDRAHRIGQNKAVSVHKVITKDTIEERILALQDAKADLAQTILDAEGIAIGQLSADDLIELLSSR
ncbi:MAG: DEAD/DEAH box helicase, partial [Eggerthellaceae bacterium]|nr:DEAD/DEAH box helicase [Eggerthellaceae bacterium]